MTAKRLTHSEAKEFADKHVHPKLRRSLRLYLLISVIVLVMVIVTGIRAHASALIVLCGLIAGILIGILFNRVYKISWDKEADQAIYKMDVFGIALLVVFVTFDLSRHHLVELFTHGNSVGATSLALLTGAMYGRVLGTGRSIARVFKEEKVLQKLDKGEPVENL